MTNPPKKTKINPAKPSVTTGSSLFVRKPNIIPAIPQENAGMSEVLKRLYREKKRECESLKSKIEEYEGQLDNGGSKIDKRSVSEKKQESENLLKKANETANKLMFAYIKAKATQAELTRNTSSSKQTNKMTRRTS